MMGGKYTTQVQKQIYKTKEKIIEMVLSDDYNFCRRGVVLVVEGVNKYKMH